MKLDQAIRILNAIDETYSYTHFPGRKDAIKLGIEALKAVKKFQSMGSKINPLRLPGETEE